MESKPGYVEVKLGNILINCLFILINLLFLLLYLLLSLLVAFDSSIIISVYTYSTNLPTLYMFVIFYILYGWIDYHYPYLLTSLS